MSDLSIFELPDLWRVLAENTFDGVMFVDPNQRVVYWNCQAGRITGFTADEVLGQNCLVGVRCPNCLRRCGLFTKGEICERTVTLMTKTGREITVVKNAQLVRDPDGNVLGGIEIFRRIPGSHAGQSGSDEAALIREALVANRYSRSKAARALGMSRATLWRKMKKHGL